MSVSKFSGRLGLILMGTIVVFPEHVLGEDLATATDRQVNAAQVQSGADGHPATLPDTVRAATEKYQDPAAAIADGYVAMACVSGPGGGAMGSHYVKPALLDDGEIDVARPEALMYEPQADGSAQLLGIEFITYTGPAVLNGHLFHLVGSPNRYGMEPFYQLHVWAWRENRSGTFADFNPDVSCDGMIEQSQVAH